MWSCDCKHLLASLPVALESSRDEELYGSNRVVFGPAQSVLLLTILALAVSACQSTSESGPAAVTNSWSPAPLARADDSVSRRVPTKGMPLLDSAARTNTTMVEGTGRFIGEPPAGNATSSAVGKDDGVTLNLVNVPAPQAAKTILGDILGVKYTVDPGIEGKITIQTPKPVARASAVDLFETALRANNAALVNANGTYKIVGLQQAAVGAPIRTDGVIGTPDTERIGTGVHVVQLKYVAASEIRRILEPMAPKGSIMGADNARNTITFSGNSQDIAGLMEAVAVFDVDVMKGMSFALVPVRTSQPGAIADELRTIFASDREGPMAGMVQFLPNKRLGAILVVSAQPKYLQRAEGWVRKLDAQAEGSEKQFFTYSVQNRRAQELVSVLQSMFSNETGANGGSGRTVAPQYREASMQSRSGLQASPASFGGASPGGGLAGSKPGFGQQRGSQVATADPGATAQIGRDEATGEPRIKVAADEAKNAILIEATPADYRRVMRVMGTLDVMPNQVLIEATIAEVSLNDQLKFGVRSFVKDGKSTFSFSDDVGGAISSVYPGFSYALRAANVAATLNALNEITDINVISSPTLTVMDNKTAMLQIGDQVPITTQSAVGVLTPGAPVVNSVSYRDTGVILAMTPQINESGRVLLDIEQEVSTVAATTSSTIDSPTIRQRRIRTSVVVNDGEALALGGLIQDMRTVSRAQVPILGDIPVIGAALGHRDNQIGKTELIIIITPHVIRNLREARQVTDEFRRELAIGARIRPRVRSVEENVRRIVE